MNQIFDVSHHVPLNPRPMATTLEFEITKEPKLVTFKKTLQTPSLQKPPRKKDQKTFPKPQKLFVLTSI